MSHSNSTEISGWGRYPRVRAHTVAPGTTEELTKIDGRRRIARGQGRSYGDAALLSDGLVIITDKLSKISSWDRTQGLLTAESGMTLAEILQAPETRGWFPSVVPGTKQVSLGGAVAADIHGKNHHRVGSFGNHVIDLEILTAGGDLVTCSPKWRPEFFWATVGGMGLTGIITRVTVRLIPNETEYMVVKHVPTKNLDEALELSESSDYDDEYSVVWLDCVARPRTLGRGVFISGHHAKLDELPVKFRSRQSSPPKVRRVPFDFPRWLLNQFTVGVFDDLYYWRQGRRRSPFISDYDSFFFPLDRIGDWNRMYGSRGFIQYQSVLPTQTAVKGLNAMLGYLLKRGRSSYLTVLKRFGPENKGLLSFPTEGYTLTFDFPVEPDLFPFLDDLDQIVLEHGGRVYLAKDARMSREVFSQMYPGLGEWLRLKSELDPQNIFSSDLSRRLGLGSFS